MLDLWELGGPEDDSHLTVLDARAVLTARLMDFLPDIPVVADNLGLGKGEIMEVKVPVGSSFMYRHISSITQKKWRIAMIYRGSNFMIAKPSEGYFNSTYREINTLSAKIKGKSPSMSTPKTSRAAKYASFRHIRTMKKGI